MILPSSSQEKIQLNVYYVHQLQLIIANFMKIFGMIDFSQK